MNDLFSIIIGDTRDVLPTLPAQSVHCCVTSPPYFGLRDYGVSGQIGLEPTPDEFVGEMVKVFREVRRVLRDDGTLWLNLGDSYGTTGGNIYECSGSEELASGGINFARPAGDKRPKNLLGIPWRVAFALQSDGWYLRQDIIWAKPNPMPESVTDRCTKSHEYIFLMAKSERYFCDMGAIKEKAVEGFDLGLLRGRGASKDSTMVAWHAPSIKERQDDGLDSRFAGSGFRNKRSVWTINSHPFKEAHFATFPPKLIEPCILAGCPVGGTVLDPFNGAGTTGLVSLKHGRKYIGIELNQAYAAMAEKRIRRSIDGMLNFDEVPA